MGRRRTELIFLCLGLLVAWLASRGVDSPGYMDADYYYAMGSQIAKGQGDQEPFLWNYMADPQAVPAPSFSYWSPLTAILAGFALRCLGTGFRIAQLPFILCTSLLPVMAYRLAQNLGVGRNLSIQSGMLALSPGFFLPFFVTTDVFSVYALLGGTLMLLLTVARDTKSVLGWAAIGLVVGLAHLSRVDGFILMIIPIYVLYAQKRSRWGNLFWILLGYGLIMIPWLLRNLETFGSVASAAGSRAFWLRTYDEFFSFPPHILTPERWWTTGFAKLLSDRWGAIVQITQRIIAENGLIIMLPFMLIGIKRTWQHRLVQGSTYYLVALAGLMGLVFPFAGARGGWFHSSASMMPLLWVMAPVGLQRCVRWLAERRKWPVVRAELLFGVTLVLFTGLITWGLYISRVVGSDPDHTSWSLSEKRYQVLESILRDHDPVPGIVAINNPPGFFITSGLPSVVIPSGGIDALQGVVRKFNVGWILLDSNHPADLLRLYKLEEVPAWMKFEGRHAIEGEDFAMFSVRED